MSLINDMLLVALPDMGVSLYDARQAFAGAPSQILRGQANRFTGGAPGGSAILPSLAIRDAPPFLFVINDSANPIPINPAPGDTIMGATASMSLQAGSSALMIAVDPARISKGGGYPPAQIVQDWSYSLITEPAPAPAPEP